MDDPLKCRANTVGQIGTDWCWDQTLIKYLTVSVPGKPYVPQSCCRPEGDLNICTGIDAWNGPPSQGPPLASSLSRNPHLYTKVRSDLQLYLSSTIQTIKTCMLLLLCVGSVLRCSNRNEFSTL